MKTFTAKIRSRSRFTISEKIRVMTRLKKGQIVSLIRVGDSVIIIPKGLELDRARRGMKKILKSS